MDFRFAVLPIALALAGSASAHDFSAELAKFQRVAAAKKADSKEAIQARVALERAQAQLDQADVKMLLRIRSLTNTALRELGEQPAFLSSEHKRLEAALANPKTKDPQKIAKAREIFAQLAYEKPVYDALESEATESMTQALRLIESASSK